jgi:hypothetical protein
MTVRIPPITTPVAGEGDDDDPRSINSLWYRYLQSLQQSIPDAGIPDAPSDGKLYGRQDAAWAEVPSPEDVDLGYSADATAGTVSNTGGTGFVVPTFTRQNAGLVPAPITGTDTRFLREDGTWQTAGGTFDPNDEVFADIVRFNIWGGSGAGIFVAAGVTAAGYTPANVNGNNSPFGAATVLGRRLHTRYSSNAAWGVRTTTTALPCKIGNNVGLGTGLGDFLIVFDFGITDAPSAWDGQLFVGASDGNPATSPIETFTNNYCGFMRPQALGNYRVAYRSAGGAQTLVDTGINRGVLDGSLVRRFVIYAFGGNVTFEIWNYTAATNRFDERIYTNTVTSGLPTVAMSPQFGGPTAQNTTAFSVQSFRGWVRL